MKEIFCRLMKQEKKDLVAFLHALTDESRKPAIPDKVPSGLPVVPHLTPTLKATAQSLSTRALELEEEAQRIDHELRVVLPREI